MIVAHYKYIESTSPKIWDQSDNWRYWSLIGKHHNVDSILKQLAEYEIEEVEPGLYVFYIFDAKYHCKLYDLNTNQVVVKESPWKVGLND